jgi:hypothetical protein
MSMLNDTVVMGSEEWENMQAMKSTLHLFEWVSSFKVNTHKIGWWK